MLVTEELGTAAPADECRVGESANNRSKARYMVAMMI